MELKEYQIRALESFDIWFDVLEHFRQDRQDAHHLPEEYRSDYLNFPKQAWKELARLGNVADREHVNRNDGAGRPIPHVCFKVPTGGGKTLLAASVLERIRYPAGLVLWIVPTRAIYEQTKNALWDREHPYRQRLERASGGRVILLEKDSPFSPADIDNYLCVMLLMFPATNRKRHREFLRMFRDSGRYHSFFPGSDHDLYDADLLEQFDDLESTDGLVKQSLFNVIKLLRPVVILDEAHKAYGKNSKSDRARQFAATVNRLNPRLVLEFSATPNPNISNLLVDISGAELKSEEMIKMPVQISSLMKPGWQDSLSKAAEKLSEIDKAAIALHQQEDRYIRPIAVVRVERTGREMRDGFHVHAEDVREHLVQQMGVPAEAVRVKSAERDELEREDLLSETCPVRWIITRAALLEGWDCPFAYLLVILDNTKSQTALTQLVGRILRQPHAKLTKMPELNRCYVFCWNLDVGEAVSQVRDGLEGEGLTGLSDGIESVDATDTDHEMLSIMRRVEFRDCQISIPKVLHREGSEWRELDHLQDIVSNVNWDDVSPFDVHQHFTEAAYVEVATIDIDAGSEEYFAPQRLEIDKTLRISWFARRLSDVVPNPWRAAQFALQLMKGLQDAGRSDEEIFDNRAIYAEQLRFHLLKESDRLCKAIFEMKLRNGHIRFDLLSEPSFTLDDELNLRVSDDDRTLQRRRGEFVQLSLFDPVFEKQFDSRLEMKFAVHLDEQPTLKWWHRIQREYYLLGWRRQKIYPDFVAFGEPHFCIFETKGRHLENADTQYKIAVLQLLEQHFNQQDYPVYLKEDHPVEGKFAIVYNSEFPELGR